MPRNPRLAWKNNLARDAVTGRYHVRVMIGGRVIQRAFPTRRAAVAALEHYSLQAAGIPTETVAPTLAEALEVYVERLALLQRSEATEDYYRRRMKPLIVALGELRLDRLDQRRLEEYVGERSQEVGAGTVNKELHALVTICRHHGLTPAWRLPSLSHHPRSRMVQAPAVVALLWRELSPPARAAVGLCLLAGMRASEATAAEASWVHGEELWVPVRKTGGWNRTALVATLAAARPRERKLVTVDDAPLRYELEKVSKRHGITPPYRGPGAFRHHCATWAVDAGCTRDQVREVLSHQGGTVTDRYVHSQAVAIKRRVLETVEGVLLEALGARPKAKVEALPAAG